LQYHGVMKDRLNAISEQIIGAAIDVHREIGPGTLESTCLACLVFELRRRKLKVEREVLLPIVYRNQRIEKAFRLDLMVEDEVIVEVKCVERVHPVHVTQLRSYLRLSHRKLGLLINFNVKRVALDGVTRVVNEFPD
jgi:GxxExxY protein